MSDATAADFYEIDDLIDVAAAYSGRHRDHVSVDLRTDHQCPPDLRWRAALESLSDDEPDTWARGGSPVTALRNLVTALRRGHRGEIMADGLPRDRPKRVTS